MHLAPMRASIVRTQDIFHITKERFAFHAFIDMNGYVGRIPVVSGRKRNIVTLGEANLYGEI